MGLGPLVESVLQNICCSGVSLETKEGMVVTVDQLAERTFRSCYAHIPAEHFEYSIKTLF